MISITLISIAARDQLRRAEAKRLLSNALRDLNDEELDWISLLVRQRRRPPILFVPPFEVKITEKMAARPLEVLNQISEEPWGERAMAALFQRSPTGRARYFSQIAASVRASRRAQGKRQPAAFS